NTWSADSLNDINERLEKYPLLSAVYFIYRAEIPSLATHSRFLTEDVLNKIREISAKTPFFADAIARNEKASLYVLVGDSFDEMKTLVDQLSQIKNSFSGLMPVTN